ncbi:hypothetical protein E8E14_007571 [Neopestalotiopsis sp. 37M]|nr:hypothetical protein E8E14_007571 [Neopestalotiopsis sp. 37M]
MFASEEESRAHRRYGPWIPSPGISTETDDHCSSSIVSGAVNLSLPTGPRALVTYLRGGEPAARIVFIARDILPQAIRILLLSRKPAG